MQPLSFSYPCGNEKQTKSIDPLLIHSNCVMEHKFDSLRSVDAVIVLKKKQKHISALSCCGRWLQYSCKNGKNSVVPRPLFVSLPSYSAEDRKRVYSKQQETRMPFRKPQSKLTSI